MTTHDSSLPLRDVLVADNVGDVRDTLREAAVAREAVYPLGGETGLNYGLAPTAVGVGLSLRELNDVVRYTPRDMTVTVEAGVTMHALADQLAGEGQHLPIDAPRIGEATVGGCAAVNQSGPRRYGYGSLRDYIIGIQAVDGRGVAFRGGGNVVKNVAGYDFCKLLCGSLGTLAVITELTLKVIPLRDCVESLAVAIDDWATADNVLETLTNSQATPTSIDLVGGPHWGNTCLGTAEQSECCTVFLRLEGTRDEVAWMAERVRHELANAPCRIQAREDAEAIRQATTDFADVGATPDGDAIPLTVRITVPPSAATLTIRELLADDPQASFVAYAGSGVVIVRCHQFAEADLTRRLLAEIQPAAVRRGGNCVVLSSSFDGLTRQVVWGGRTPAIELMERIRAQFDPHGILNPGRFVY